MRPGNVPRNRSQNLRLDGGIKGGPAAVVARLGAVQSQDYLPAQWSLAQRTSGLSRADVDRALADGSIVRTHVLRPTWHFLARADARWMLELTGPRIRRSLAHRHRNLGLDARTLSKAERVVTKVLDGGEQMTRKELGAALTKSGLDGAGQRLPHMLGFFELDLAICSGARRGNDHTWALFDERVPASEKLDEADAVRRLVERYLQSHGPAAIADLGWWAGLKISEIRTALNELGPRVQNATVDDIELWWVEDGSAPRTKAEVRLLETYDEYVVGYTKSRFIGDPHRNRAIDAWRSRTSPPHVVTRAGAILGGWRRTKKGSEVTIQVELYERQPAAVTASLRREAKRFADFYDFDLSLEIETKN